MMTDNYYGSTENVPADIYRNIRNKALEDAAAICSDHAKRNAETLDLISPGDIMDVAAITLTGAVSALKLAAAAIRALKTPTDAEEEQLAKDLKAAAYADYHSKRDRDWQTNYDDRGDMTPDGRNIADTYRRIVRPQMRANKEGK